MKSNKRKKKERKKEKGCADIFADVEQAANSKGRWFGGSVVIGHQHSTKRSATDL